MQTSPCVRSLGCGKLGEWLYLCKLGTSEMKTGKSKTSRARIICIPEELSPSFCKCAWLRAVADGVMQVKCV